MTQSKDNSLLALVQSFFRDYLGGIRGASAHTIRAYRDALKLFFLFLAQGKRRPIAELSLEDIQAEAVLSFLGNVETQRRNSATSRNCRLAALRSFVQHLLRHDIARANQYGRILAIPSKRAPVRLVSFLEPEEARAVIAAVEARTPLACARSSPPALSLQYRSSSQRSLGSPRSAAPTGPSPTGSAFWQRRQGACLSIVAGNGCGPPSTR